jgi:SAM-dependent methyltransferase
MFTWDDYILKDYSIRFGPEALVLDVGCGYGEQMKELIGRGSSVVGVDLDTSSLARCRAQGLNVLRARAEELPVKDSSLDGILCKVVLPYTREEEAIREFSRLLKPGGRCYLQCQGAGYFLKYLLLSTSLKERFYALRTIVNTWLWLLTGLRLPGFLGDSIYQSRRRLAKYFRANGLTLLEDTPSPRFLKLPVFTYQLIEKLPHNLENDPHGGAANDL